MTKKRRRKPAAEKADAGTAPVAPSYQEGSVDSAGGGPSGTDRSDRSGEGTPRAGTAPQEKGRDAFVSSEVGVEASTPGKDPRTTS
jgi:hypothetical protein